jgi:hypothetical protein
MLGAVAVSGCVGAGSEEWSFTINGDATLAVNASLFEAFEKASTFNNALMPDGNTANGISLELFLYHFGLYPVTGISFGGTAYDWKTVVESVDEATPVLVREDGSIYYNGTTTKVDNIDVTTGEKPAVSTLDVEPSVLYALGAGGSDDLALGKASSRAIIFYVDALGYDRYTDALSRGLAANMSSIGEPVKAIAVYPTITQANAIAMMTGKGTDLAKGSFRSTLPGNDTLFDLLGREGIRCAWIDGSSAPITLSNTILNNDTNGDGSEDDEMADAAIRAYQSGAGLVVAHFDDPDEAMHAHGPYSPEGLASVKATDALVGKVLKSLDQGTLIIVWADHGCHTVPGAGNHGTLATEDMYVPIIVGYA